MSERHGDHLALRTAPVTSATVILSGHGAGKYAWREARNGVPESRFYEWNGYPGGGDPRREAEVAAQLAAIRAEAMRRVLAPGEEGFRMDRCGFWVPCRREDD